ncbi:MAG TPA: class I tRNA ligase family protein, partial [Candidatus Levybacteria bacterium]|nr:class I tRNA ligase family protein [Candidatus Levybacteria bacterium]
MKSRDNTDIKAPAHKQFKPAEFEAKWQKEWESDKTFSPDLDSDSNPYYTLMMFPYPSAEGMHVGNMYAHTGADIHGRFKRMQGFDVFEPIGLDGFGIHSENYAMKVGRHPKEQAKISEKNFYRQMYATGSGFDWQRTVETYDPEYYKWTQWLFTQMFKAGLAYKDTALVNYCPSCKTVLSDEQVIAGECERCGSIVEKKELEQWFFRITQYAGRLLDNIPKLDWSEKVKVAQTNWIGRSKGALITFPIADFVL